MRVLLLTDDMFGVCERALLERLHVGLSNEGFDVHLAVPEHLALTGMFDLLNVAHGYRHTRLTPVRRLVAQRLSEELVGGDDQELSVVHAFGGDSWDLAFDIAALTGAVVVLELWRVGLVSRLRGLRPRRGVRFVAVVPDRTMEREVLKDSHGIGVRITPWGGVVAPERTKIFREGREVGLAMIGNGGDIANVRAAFDGIAPILSGRDDTMLFVDAVACQRAGLWKRARQFDVRDRVSVIDHMEDRRDLILRCDVLLSPEARGEHRTILLDALGAALPVVCRSDESIELLQTPGITVRVMASTAQLWTEAVGSLLEDPAQARQMGEAARQHISEHQRWSKYVATVTDVYEWVTRSASASEASAPASGAGS
ncbi:MAG: glycosyltransferase [Phycisphaerales bacterium JB040]